MWLLNTRKTHRNKTTKRVRETKTNDMCLCGSFNVATFKTNCYCFLYFTLQQYTSCTVLYNSIVWKISVSCVAHKQHMYRVAWCHAHVRPPWAHFFFFFFRALLFCMTRLGHDVIQFVVKFDTIFKVHWMKNGFVFRFLKWKISIFLWHTTPNFPVRRSVHDLIKVQCTRDFCCCCRKQFA